MYNLALITTGFSTHLLDRYQLYELRVHLDDTVEIININEKTVLKYV